MKLVIVVLATLLCGGQCEKDCSSIRDYNTQCAGWFDLGYCESDSQFHKQARKLCPSSCSNCGFQFTKQDDCPNLEDTLPQCHKWMLAGKCSYLGQDYDYTMKNCPFSCNGCQVALYGEGEECAQLSDYNTHCRKWAKKGLCDRASHSGFMAKNCSYSCAGCKDEICAVARDVSDSCANYKSRGWCERNHFYYKDIANDCQATCNNCT